MAEYSSPQIAVDWQSFSYLTVEKAEIYRSIINVFADAKAEFLLHLRPAQIRETLRASGIIVEFDDVESALQQLETWGNLQSYQDRSDAPSLAEFYRKSLLYQMTAAGEAAHASTLTFIERLQQQAKLDARALDRIGEASGQLERITSEARRDWSNVDSVVVLTTIRSLCRDVDELTSRAQSFFRWLHEQTESERADLESFLQYKERLIDYLQQFIGELITGGAKIARRLNMINNDEYARLARIVAEEEMGDPRAGEEDLHAQRMRFEQLKWEQRLLGLRGWFGRSAGNAAQLDQLRSAARAAIPRLLQLAAQMNERETGKSDRVSDLRTLAVSFLQCDDDGMAHRLFREAFALAPARHLRIDQVTIDDRDQHPVSADTRWLDAEPVVFSPQLRSTGREGAASASRKVVDRSKAQAAARRRLATDAGREDSSRETLIAMGRRRLSEVGELDTDAFRLLMELIELAVPRTSPNDNPKRERGDGDNRIALADAAGFLNLATATSRDGSVRITIQQPVNELTSVATVATEAGHVLLHDVWIEVQRAR